MWVLVSLVMAGVAVAPAVVGASTFILADEQQLAHQADAIFIATVEQVEAAYDSANAAVTTNIRLRTQQVWKGEVPSVLHLQELGGNTKQVTARFFGVPEYQVGEQVLVFATQRGGRWATTSMAMGKYTLAKSNTGVLAVRDLGPGTTALRWDGRSLQPAPPRAVYDLEDLRRSVRDTLAGYTVSRALPLEAETDTTVSAPFGLMGSPGRWFQPDEGQPVGYFVDENGDASLGVEQTNAAVSAAMLAWSAPEIATIRLQVAGTVAPERPRCSGPTQIIFNDPWNVISDPWFCSGVLAIGGYCADNNTTTTVNGVSFSRIVSALILFNNGWGQCPFWNTCNVAEILTHELGHTIGIGHSADGRATMFAYAHFDGRCAALRADDLAAVSFIYPAASNLDDAVVLPPKQAKARIRRGKPEVYWPLVVAVRHGDTWGESARFRLLARDGNCPEGTVGAPNFGMFPAAPNEVALAPGASAKATVWLRLASNSFATPDARAPSRCELEFTAEPTVADNIDPFPGNETVRVPLDVLDENDFVAKGSSTQVVLQTTKPLSLRLARGKAELAKLVTVKVRNGATSDTVSVSVDPGTCPVGLLSAPLVPRSTREFLGMAAPAGSQLRAQVPLVFGKEMAYSVFPGSPARCTARLHVAGQAVDSDPSNNTLPLVIDLQDDNDL